MGRTRGGGAIVGLVGRWDINFQLYARCVWGLVPSNWIMVLPRTPTPSTQPLFSMASCRYHSLNGASMFST